MLDRFLKGHGHSDKIQEPLQCFTNVLRRCSGRECTHYSQLKSKKTTTIRIKFIIVKSYFIRLKLSISKNCLSRFESFEMYFSPQILPATPKKEILTHTIEVLNI